MNREEKTVLCCLFIVIGLLFSLMMGASNDLVTRHEFKQLEKRLVIVEKLCRGLQAEVNDYVKDGSEPTVIREDIPKPVVVKESIELTGINLRGWKAARKKARAEAFKLDELLFKGESSDFFSSATKDHMRMLPNDCALFYFHWVRYDTKLRLKSKRTIEVRVLARNDKILVEGVRVY